MEKLKERLNELCAECNQIFDNCEKSFKEGEDNKIVLTDKCGRKLAIIPFRKALTYIHSYGIIYHLFGVTSMADHGYDYLAVVCFDFASHFAIFEVDSLSLDKRIEIADMIVDYKHRGKREYDYEETKKFVSKLCKKK